MSQMKLVTRKPQTQNASLRACLFYFVFFSAMFILFEGIVHVCAFGWNCGVSFFKIMFALTSAVLPALLCGMIPPRAAKIVSCVLSGVLMIVYDIQLIYQHIFDSFCSLTQSGMGMEAVKNFHAETVRGIRECALPLVLMAIPFIAGILLAVWHHPKKGKMDLRILLAGIITLTVLHFGTVLLLPAGGTATYSPFDIYHQTFVLEMSERYFGVLTSARLEVRGILFPQNSKTAMPNAPVILPVDTEPTAGSTSREDQGNNTGDSDAAQTEAPPIEYPDQTLDIDFASRMQTETEERIRTLDNYFSKKIPTKQNAYTGMFEGYNLIVLCCESFSPYVIDSERTPVLARMAEDGFRFSNYYNTVSDNTSNGEYALCTGLLPDTSLLGRGWDTFYHYNSFTSAENNLLPFCLGNQLRAQGYQTYAIHNYYGDYYDRNQTHPNMGYTFRAMAYGLKRVSDWPTSDVSMIEQSKSLFLTPDENGEVAPFHVYYLTFSGHMSYLFSANDMANKNRALTENLPYAESVCAYLACQQELEYALETLLDELEKAGELDHTLIALTADHYPYNLGLTHLSELAGRELDSEFDKYRGSFLLWSASMTEPVDVEVPCCTLDILPTLSNLLGLPYDSRLLIGNDILSDSMHVALFADRSFVTDRVRYNAQNGEAELLQGSLPDGYLDALIAYTHDSFTISSEILYTDYYRSVYASLGQQAETTGLQ